MPDIPEGPNDAAWLPQGRRRRCLAGMGLVIINRGHVQNQYISKLRTRARQVLNLFLCLERSAGFSLPAGPAIGFFGYGRRTEKTLPPGVEEK